MGRRNLLVGSVADPRIRDFAVPCLPEAVHQIAKSSAEHIADAGSGEQSTELPGRAAARAALWRRRRTARAALRGTEPFRDLVPVLIACDCEERQQRCHRRISATHLILLLARASSYRRAPDPG